MTDAREESTFPTHDTVTLDERQRQLVHALYEAYRRDLHGLKNEPLDESDWEGVVCDDATVYVVQDAVMARKCEALGGYKVSLTSPETQRMLDSDCPLYGAQVTPRFVPTPCTLD